MSFCAADTHSAGVATVHVDTGRAVISLIRLPRKSRCSRAFARTSCFCDAAAHLKQHRSVWPCSQRQQRFPCLGTRAALKRRMAHVAPVPRTPCVLSALDPVNSGAFRMVCKMADASSSGSSDAGRMAVESPIRSTPVDDGNKRPHSHACHAPFPPLSAAITRRSVEP